VTTGPLGEDARGFPHLSRGRRSRQGRAVLDHFDQGSEIGGVDDDRLQRGRVVPVRFAPTNCVGRQESLLTTPPQRYLLRPAIHEILVSGDLAVVRLIWTLTAEKNGAKDVTTEEGMDVFRRASDGQWSIARYIAFTTRPNAVLSHLRP
jgi:hypothetical protein